MAVGMYFLQDFFENSLEENTQEEIEYLLEEELLSLGEAEVEAKNRIDWLCQNLNNELIIACHNYEKFIANFGESYDEIYHKEVPLWLKKQISHEFHLWL